MVKKTKKKQSKPTVTQHKHTEVSHLKRYSIWFMLFITLLVVALSGYWYFYNASTHTKALQQIQAQNTVSTDALMSKMKKMLEDEKERQASLPPVAQNNVTVAPLEVPTEVLPEVTLPIEPRVYEEHNTTALVPEEHPSKTSELSEVHEYQESLKESGHTYKPNEVIRKKYPAGTIPKLAIIIDDVSFPWQVRMMKEIPYKVTPAFFPPTKRHPETVRLSHEFPFAMVHLPLEAKYYSRPEEDTLNTTDSLEVIEQRIKRIKAWFPHIVYYNNHTGGYFTADYQAMDRLIKVMKAHELVFVDSRTIGNSKAPEVTKKYDMFLYSRDVFLDNSLEKHAIITQLKEAVTKAKKNGYAIAIGHPHKNTLEVLRDSKALLEGVELVYLKEL
ncbi:divergent polysaccharide deacetylase family protein [Sulfurospirillum barnesii]|uniref:Divergent polysaccharide deacetylase n=1 Tax=Sulfurospirillum barnesii (strain ATCC 700032 / DSM 10660 / SES-3) TaxID=760154 RepID=I3XWA4_SULBS|nr:divergent polysaccharide deacetylase family protein [Sulfurospirillum barnesii]AFL68228.1 hypothetical protein Sulba_0927 [Sulfurospirillum barnesii SES-3]